MEQPYVLLFSDHMWYACYYRWNADKFIKAYKQDHDVSQVIMISPYGDRQVIEL